ncbi:hypothetical protein C0580_01480 [Candidatus Parcubacteria bacterium]|nr:MAG: hypothetical protein C0580_01480 [Candidatus Parcubacteria bacterium]
MAKNEKKEPKNEELDAEHADDDFGEILAHWEFHEYEKPTRNKKWYIWFAIIFIILILLSISDFSITVFTYADRTFDISFYQNPLFVILIALFALVYFYTERQEPNKLNFFVAEDGILIEDRLVEYKDIESFYIVYQPPGIKNVYFQPKNHILPLITIPLEDSNPVELRHILLDFIEENLDKEDEPASDSLSRALKL